MIAHVVVAGEIGGAERMLLDLAHSSDHVVLLMTPSEQLRALLRATLDVEDRGPAREDPLSFLKRALGRRDVAWAEAVFRRRNVTTVHLHTFGSQVIGTRAAQRVGARIVRTEHSTRVYDDASCWPFSRWSLKRADASVCISDHVRRVAIAKAPWAGSKMTVIPNGVDIERFAPRPLPEGPLRLVMVGRLEPRKGVDIALHALARVPHVALDIAGDGESRAELEALSSRLGLGARVRFLGYQSDVRHVIANAHLALSSAREEGLGIALLEAMAMGRAVVALPTGGIPEIVEDGRTGWLARGRDAPALAAALNTALADGEDARARGQRAVEAVHATFSLDAMRRRYAELYAQPSV